MHMRKPSPGTAVAAVALFFAMGGTAIAAHHYLITSTKQIKPSVLKALKGNVGPAGPAGLPGVAGKEGLPGKEGKEGKEGKQGPPGPTELSRLAFFEGPSEKAFEVGPGEWIAVAVSDCPEGSRAVSGSDAVTGFPLFKTDEPHFGPKGEFIGWFVFGFGFESFEVEAKANCATAGDAVQASRVRSPAQEHELARSAGQAFLAKHPDLLARVRQMHARQSH
jgi:hypothetical protein